MNKQNNSSNVGNDKTSKQSGISRRDLIKSSPVLAGGYLAMNSMLSSMFMPNEAKAAISGSLTPSLRLFPLDNFTPEINIAGKVAVITGASRGIGRATGEALSALGVNVIGTSRNVATVPNPPAYPMLNLDIADVKSADKFMNDLKTTLGQSKVDILISNAGRTVFGYIIPPNLADKQKRDFYFAQTQLAVETLYHGHVRMTQSILPLMSTSGYARILFTASISAYAAGGTEPVGSFSQPYFSSKRAILAFANHLRAMLQFSGSNIQVTTVNPLFVATDLGGPDRMIYTQQTGADGFTGDPFYDQVLMITRQLIAGGLPASFAGNTYAQLLRMNQPPANVAVGSTVEPYASQGGTALVEGLLLAENTQSAAGFSCS